jgi:hypothetical protein
MGKAFKKLFTESHPRIPKKLQTDKGKEFYNKEVKSVLSSYGVELFSTDSIKKAAVVERFNRTLKNDAAHYFTEHQTKQYTDVLSKLLHAYNHRYHRSIKMAPVEVTKHNEDQVWVNLYGDGGKTETKRDKDVTPAQMVRISKSKGDFAKGYVPNWSCEDFQVIERQSHPRTVYKLQDRGGRDIKGAFYREEIQPISKNRYLVEKVLRSRTAKDGTVEKLVKWLDWDKEYNTWVPATDLEKL